MSKYIPVFILQASYASLSGVYKEFKDECFYFRTLQKAKDFAQLFYEHYEARQRIVAWKKDPNADVPCFLLIQSDRGEYKRYNSVWRIEEHDMREALQ